MKKREDFFNEEPPIGHEQRILNAVAPELAKNRADKPSLLFDWRMKLAAGGALAVGIFAITQRPRESEEFIEFQGLVEGDVLQSGTELDDLADEVLDLEILENLDLLVDMEDV